MLLPLIYLIIRALDADAAAWSALGDASSLRLVLRTALLALAVAGASLVLALPMAWLTVRTDLPLRRLWSVLAIVPLVVPSYVGAVAFIAAFGPRGTLQEILSPLGVDTVPQIYGFAGAFLALTLFSYPYLLLVLRAGLRGIDPALEDASRSLGMGSWRTFLRVTVPQLRVPITAGSLLVALYVVSDFGAVSLLRTDTLTRAIFIQYQTSFDRAAAAVLGLELVGLVTLILVLEWLYRRRGRFHGGGPGTPGPPRLLRLGRWRWPALAFLAAIVLVALGVPTGVLLHWLVRGLQAGEPFAGAWGAALNSAWVSAVAGLVAVVVAIPVAIVAVRKPSPLAAIVERVGYTGFALPGIVVALSLVFFGLRVVPAVYQSWVLLVFAYLVLFFPLALGGIRTSLVQIRPGIEEAARSLGGSPGRVLATITIPLLIPGLVSGFALVFLTAMKELPATLLLAPIGFDTLATEVWSASSEAFFARAAAPALILILVAALPLALLVAREHRVER
ncbi:MAG: iron ABC transporter permease [Chloroflexi bacterium]|nr:iron ABC transporter permease [Chloroflexota bacterium]